MPSYLFVWLFLLGISLGAMALLFLHNLTGGDWGDSIRPLLMALVRLIPYCALLVIPLLLRLPVLFSWMQASNIARPETESTQAWYLNETFFWIRSVLYFVLWIGFGYLLQRQPTAGTSAASLPNGASAVGLVVYLLTTTFASIDWTMSLTPQWHSTEFGLLISIGQVLSALAFCVAGIAWSEHANRARLLACLPDLGNLLLALVLFWSYLVFMQFLIIWIEDLPNDISWYLPRAQEGWRGFALLLVCVHFAVPFVFLLSRRIKQTHQSLGVLAALLIFACLIDTFWLVIPPFRPEGFEFRWNDLLALLAIGGVWFGLFMRITHTHARTADWSPIGDRTVHHA